MYLLPRTTYISHELNAFDRITSRELILGCPFEKGSIRELILVDKRGNSSGLGRACDHPRVVSSERERVNSLLTLSLSELTTLGLLVPRERESIMNSLSLSRN